MGLPIWRAPSPIPSKEAAKPKSDPTSASRSSIRRRRSSRSPPLRRAAALQRIAAHEAGAHYGLQSSGSRSPSSISSVNRSALDLQLQEHVERRISLPPPVPSVPESRSFTRSRSPQRDPSYISRYETRPAEYMNPASLRTTNSRPRRRLPYTADFAPAHIASFERRIPTLERMANEGNELASQTLERRRALLEERHRLVRDHLRDTRDELLGEIVTLPRRSEALQTRSLADGPFRTSNLRDAWSPATTIDGLGDRQRSMTPEEWGTMQETIQPDQQLPSAGSSFASAAASASFSNSHASSRSGSANSNSASSAQTHMTIPPPQTEDAPAVICDSSDDSDSDLDRGNLLRAHNPPLRYRTRRAVSRVPEDGTSSTFRRRYYREADGLLGSNPFRTERDRWRDVRSHGIGGDMSSEDAMPLEPEPRYEERIDIDTTSTSHMGDSELDQLRPLLERVARRGNVPEDFWLSVGLAPVVAQTVDRANAASVDERS